MLLEVVYHFTLEIFKVNTNPVVKMNMKIKLIREGLQIKVEFCTKGLSLPPPSPPQFAKIKEQITVIKINH